MNAEKEALRSRAANISTLVRRFNLREGLELEDDRLPKGLHRQLLKTGEVITEEELQFMVNDYYRLRGWDEKGKPSS